MAARFGIDTSILAHLLTGDPEDGFERCVSKLTVLIERDDAEIFASTQLARWPPSGMCDACRDGVA